MKPGSQKGPKVGGPMLGSFSPFEIALQDIGDLEYYVKSMTNPALPFLAKKQQG